MNERQRLLRQIDILENQRCTSCDKSSYASFRIHCPCEAAVEIRNIGQQLIALTAKKRQVRIDAKIAELRENGLTVDGYRELREMELTNMQIIKALGIQQSDFYTWKADTIGNRPPRVPEVAHQYSKDYEERRKWRMIAQQNGIKDKTFYRRLKAGKTYQQAATEPLAKVLYDQEAAWTASLNGISKAAYRERVRNGWPSEHACRAPKSMRLEAWLKQLEDEKEKVGV